MYRRLISFLTFILVSMNLNAAANKIYDADDILAFTRIDYVTVSPNGKQIAYVTWNRDPTEKNKWRYRLNLKDSNGNFSEITHAENIYSVSWSPDGNSIAYITPNNNNQSVISIYQLNNKKIISLVKLSREIVGLHWSPTGKQIAFIAEDDQLNSATNSLKVLPASTRNLRLYKTDINNAYNVKALTPANFSISFDPFTRGFSWSPNGNYIAFAYQPSSKSIDDRNPKVAILNLTTQNITSLAYCNTHTCRQPIYSSNGQWLAFAANIPATGKAKTLLDDIEIRNQVCLINSSNQVHCLQNTYNTNPWLLAWNAESNAVFVLERYRSQGVKIYKLSENANAPVNLISTHQDFIEPLTLSLNATKKILGFGYEGVNKAPEVYTASVDDFSLHQITHMNEKYYKKLGETKILNWKSTDGTPIEGLFITPTNYDPKHSYPLYLDVHGGPSQAQAKRYLGGCDEYGNEGFVPTTCTANILSLGFVILQVNFRGSSGFGSNFNVKNFVNYGEGDFQDIMTGINYVMQHYKIDKNKIAIAGWSHGGYMTAWIISHTNLFTIAIDGDGMTDFVSYAGSSDDIDFGLRYFGVNVWENPLLYWQNSPLAYVNNIKTPLLMIHGEKDIRVPLSQAKELLTALTLLNRPVKLLIAPNQGHVPSDAVTFSKELMAIDNVLVQGLSTRN